ncbi:thiamine-phosphate kinase [Sanguibacter gelidistatuariae]|uniref:Thiamine-monophosphate kinase n=1 Tax=Sanguibacter gelidistatuariae TaxID=1814289 RepID=A0A1G6WG66_9MICO|nr:thiamine-phosphate kinase [Sanguibacter gelidistatuariae]SDD64950.1 thiamine-phosphate kinase [Sanguibacter gelidistatuariae]
MTDLELVRDLSEEQLLARFVPLLPTAASTIVGPGDDAAVVSAPDGRFVVSTDVLVEDRHFIRAWSTGYDVGWRAAMQNLADCAAMGSRATSLVVSLVIPGDLEVSWVTDLARGLADACGAHGAAVVGGDLSGGQMIVVAVTVHGDLAGRPPVLRSGAQPGDTVALAGVLGRSAAGLALLGAAVADPDPTLVAAFLRPDPPLEAGVRAGVAGASAMLDISDGLLRDAGRIARASGVTIDLLDPADSVPGDLAALSEAAGRLGIDPLTWVLTGGEDHGMLATFPAGVELPAGFRVIGSVRELGASSTARVTVAGAEPPVTGPGWDHFAG